MQTTIHNLFNNQFLIILLTSLGLSFALPAEQASAQTPVTNIENANGDSVLTIFEDGGFAVYGEFGTGTIPVENGGVRMMWYPAKAAFRAGDVTSSNNWKDDDIGQNSVAIGEDTEASGEGSIAMGTSSDANGQNSTAMGFSTVANGEGSMAIGENSSAYGQGATAVGHNTVATEWGATAMGHETAATNNFATAMGQQTTASGAWSTAMGDHTTAATNQSVTIGSYNDANRGNDDGDSDTGPLFVVGNGSDPLYGAGHSDALVLHQNGDMTISGSLGQNSDRRLKKNINPLGDGIIGKLNRITATGFEFKNQQTHPSGPQIGLIAQEVHKQFPELVSEASDGYLTVSYSKFTAVLLKGLQEQQAKFENQQTTINQLKKKTQRIAALEKQVSEIKSSRQMAGMPISTIGILLMGIAIGGGFWWQSYKEKSHQKLTE